MKESTSKRWLSGKTRQVLLRRALVKTMGYTDEDLDKLVAKLPDELVWLAHAPTTVPAETLPNHEIRA